jgi:protoheme IX farnesyltransferase
MSVLVLFTVAIGGLLASVGAAPADRIVNAVLSTALVSAAASALNQWMERETDARMRRTANRPLPAGRLTPAEVFAFGAAVASVGFAYQALTLPPAAVAVTALTFVSYLVIYTPAKTRTSLNTLIGAVPGALPPVIGWAAVRGGIDDGAAALFLVVFFWQVPHFLAIAWMYRDEYARAGHRMLTVGDPTGRLTARQMLLYLLALVPVSLLAGLAVGGGAGFVAGALALAWLFLRPVLAFRDRPQVATARAVLRASLVYLPGMLGLLLAAKYWTTT